MGDDSTDSHRGLAVARWVLIAICAGLILFSRNMTGRVGFAALLLLAILLGRYVGRREPRVLTTPHSLPPRAEPPAHAPVSEADVPRRETGN